MASERQLPLNLPHRPEMTRADFIAGVANERALAAIDAWPQWPAATVIAGPAGSGKTHLVEVWRAASGAAVVSAADLEDRHLGPLVEAGAVAVEDIDRGGLDEATLFHLLNLAAERRVPLLLTTRLVPAALPLTVPDLLSRLRAARLVELGEPDDDLRHRVLVKLFADRQLTIEPAVLDYMVTRMERSLEAANLLAAAIDEETLAERAPVTRKIAARAMARVFNRAED